MYITAGILIPFIGTMSGSAMVFLMRNKVNQNLEKLLPGFASGVMLAASVWSLIIPAIEMSEDMDIYTWFPAAAGFLAGIIFLLCLGTRMQLDAAEAKNDGKRRIREQHTWKCSLLTL